MFRNICFNEIDISIYLLNSHVPWYIEVWLFLSLISWMLKEEETSLQWKQNLKRTYIDPASDLRGTWVYNLKDIPI